MVTELHPLGLSDFYLRIPDYKMTASSWEVGRSEPWYGRVENQTKRNWCAAVRDTNQFLQVVFLLFP